MAIQIIPIPVGQSPVSAFIGGAQAGQGLVSNYLKNQANQQNVNAQPALIKAHQALLNAQIEGANLKNKYYPTTIDILQQNAKTKAGQLNQSQNRFGPGYVLNRYLQTPYGQALLSKNPQLAGNVANYISQTSADLGNNSSLPQSGVSVGAGAPVAAPTITTPQVQAGMTATAQKLLKDTTDAQARQKMLYANNLIKTGNSIDPLALTQYAGAVGSAAKKVNELGAPFNLNTPNYTNYQKNLTLAQLWAKQIRQYIGDSIQPSVATELKNLSDPSYWSNNPTIAITKFNALKDTLNKEIGTYNSSMVGTQPYINPVKSTPDVNPNAPSTVIVVDKKGNRFSLPASQLQDAIAQGYKVEK